MAYDPSFSLAMIKARELSDTMLAAALERGPGRDATLAEARRQFVALGDMLQRLSRPAQPLPFRGDNYRRVAGGADIISLFAEPSDPEPPAAA